MGTSLAKIGDDLAGKSAVVTGAATGIGYAISQLLTEHGVRVAVADIDRDKAEEAAARLGAGAIAVEMDVSNRESVKVGMAKVVAGLGSFDFVVANAGVSSMSRATDITDDQWNNCFDVNARGVFLTNQAACRYFIDKKIAGVICNTASICSKQGFPLLAHYCASKFAILGWTQSLSREMAEYGIRVNAVCPGFVKTAMLDREVEWEALLRGKAAREVLDEYVGLTPLGRLELPDDVAGIVAFLLSGASSFITGEAVNVNGGALTS